MAQQSAGSPLEADLSADVVIIGSGATGQARSPDTVFADLTDWSVVQVNGFPDYRYSDRAVIRAFADHCAETYEFLLANGVKFKEIPPDSQGAHSTGNSAHKENHTYYKIQTPPFHAAWGTPPGATTTAGSHAPRGQPFVLECRPPFVLTLYVMVRHTYIIRDGAP